MSVDWFGIDLTCEIAFGEEPKAASPSWTDVSDYLRVPIFVNRGTTSELSGISPGFMSLQLDNRDRRFDPAYTSGPYYGNLVPMVKIRVIAAVGMASATLFTGYVLGWQQDWYFQSDGTVEVTAVDGSRFTQNAELATSAYAYEVMVDEPFLYYPLQDDYESDGSVNGQRLIADKSPEYGDPSFAEVGLPIGASAGIESDGTGTSIDTARMYSTMPTTAPEAKTVELWLDGSGFPRVFYQQAGSSGFNVRLEDGGDIAVQYSHVADDVSLFDFAPISTSTDYPLSKPSHVVLTADDTNLYVYVDGQLRSTNTLDAGAESMTSATYLVDVRPDPAIGHVAVYDSTLSAARIHAHYIAGLTAFGHPYGERSGERLERVADEIAWPSGQRDIDTGDTVQGPYLPQSQQFLDYARQLTDSEQGLVFFDVDGNLTFRGRQSLWRAATGAPVFSDDGGAGAVKYHKFRPAGNHVDNIANIATTSYSDVGAITRRDQTSIDAYGEGRRFTDCPTVDDARTASSLSAYVLRENKDPKDYIAQIDCHMRTLDGLNEFVTLAAVELGDAAVVEHTPLGIGSQVVRTVLTTGISHVIGDAQWDVSLFCSAAPTQYDDAPYLTLGDADYGKIGATAGNKIPF